MAYYHYLNNNRTTLSSALLGARIDDICQGTFSLKIPANRSIYQNTLQNSSYSYSDMFEISDISITPYNIG